MMTEYHETINRVLAPNKKCIINADLDGILSGMLLHKFLGWEVVGFSSCSGKPTDEIWVMDRTVDIGKCVYIDLPVALKSIDIIDQHFISFDEGGVDRYKNCNNKLNPNVMRKRHYSKGDYCKKYPFGTVHFILALLESIGVITEDVLPDIQVSGISALDILLRADGVIANTSTYTNNCIDWCDWLIQVGGTTTNKIFSTVKNDYTSMLDTVPLVEQKLNLLGCHRKDGDCSNMLMRKDLDKLNQYLKYLSEMFNTTPLRVDNLYATKILTGSRHQVDTSINALLTQRKVFSYAFVNKDTLSITHRV